MIRLFATPVALSTLRASIVHSCLPETCRGYAWISPFSPGRGCVSIYGGADGLSLVSRHRFHLSSLTGTLGVFHLRMGSK